MTKQDSKKVLVIGAGPAGLSAARILSEQGLQVEVFEVDSKVGGMSKSLEMFGQIVDIGPHRFFSKDTRLNDFWHAHTRGEYEKVSRLTRIFYNKKFFYYPLRGFDVLFKLGFIESALCVLSYIKAKLKPFQGDSFESWVANAFGYRLYSIFFKGYTEKLWGIKCSELDSDFAAQRIKGLNLYEAIKSAFFGGGGKKHKTLVDEFSYPKKGCGVVYENMKEEILKHGGRVHCDVNVLGIITEGKKAIGIRTDRGEVRGDIVISTAPFSDMVCSLLELDSSVRELAGGLKFRNTILVYVEVAQGNSALGKKGHSACGTGDSSLGNHSHNPSAPLHCGARSSAPHSQGEAIMQSNTAKQGEAAVSLVNTRIEEEEAQASHQAASTILECQDSEAVDSVAASLANTSVEGEAKVESNSKDSRGVLDSSEGDLWADSKGGTESSPSRHCERSEAIHKSTEKTNGLDSRLVSTNMDCHDFASAKSRNDSAPQGSQMSLDNSAESLRDFSGFTKETSQACFVAKGEGSYLSKEEADCSQLYARENFGDKSGALRAEAAENNSKILSEKSPQRDSANEAHLSVRRSEAGARRGDLSPKAELFKDNWIYVHSQDTHTGRITNFANWTKDLQCGRDSAILCLEYWANDDEELWNLSEEALSDMAQRDLLESGLVADSGLMKNVCVRKIHKSYPVYERGYKENLHRIYGALDEFRDLYFIGRNGSFKYNNQDHSILMGLLCADKILGRACNLWQINTDYDYQEGGESE